jgi:hypothetical protein
MIRKISHPGQKVRKKFNFDDFNFSEIKTMKNNSTSNNSGAQNANAPASTTEELIVQYLDGELVRKELETVLFDRLAHSDEARMLLREYLVVRGAIRVSRTDKRFQLSDDLDARTRARIQQIMEAMEHEELLVPSAASTLGGFKGDKGAIVTSPISRQLKRWQVRGSLAALSLLFAFGTFWLVSGNVNHPEVATLQPSQKATINASTVPATQAPSLTAQGSNASIAATPIVVASMVGTHTAAHLRTAKNATMQVSNPLAQNAAQVQNPKSDEPASSETSDPAAVMISHRYSKAIDAEKNEVVVSGKDRL